MHALVVVRCGIVISLMPLWLEAAALAAEHEGEPALPLKGAGVQSTPSSGSSTGGEIQQSRLFAEPLIPVGTPPSADQNRVLESTLRAFTRRVEADDFSTLEECLKKNSESPWAPALTFDLGMEYYNTGWYSKALTAWEKAWARLKRVNEPAAKPIADRAAGELAFMYGRLGRMTELEALLREVEGRTFIGPATEKIVGAREGLWTMQHRPEVGFRCGPMALDRILTSQKSTNAGCTLIYGSKSTTNGFSLIEVAELSRQLGMNYQMAFRSRGAELVVPAVVNWKVGHYAALVRREGESFLLQDPTFGNDTWASRRALEEESSGYFLVPPGKLPAGWRAVSGEEGKNVFGKGSANNKDNTCTTDQDNKKCGSSGSSSPDTPYPYAGIRGMARANAHLMLVSLNIQDQPVGYTPPVGPRVGVTVTYNQREANQPGTFTYVNLGAKWTFNWLGYIADNPTLPLADVNYFTPEGGALVFSGFDTNHQAFEAQVKSQAILTRTSTNSYEMVFKTGAKIIFNRPDCASCSSRRVFMTQIADPQGNVVTINYDSNFRITNVVDAIGQPTTFSYEHPTDTRKLTKITDPFGRFATFSYDGSGRLTNITDVIGINSQFSYDNGDFITAMITPYGTTSFEKGENGPQRWLVTTYPNGDKDRVEYFESGNIGVPYSEPVAPTGMNVQNTFLVYRNSFYWDPKTYAEAPGDYTKAHLYHWLHFAAGVAAGVLESEKAPLENRVWYNYDGQSVAYNYGTTDQPNAIGRVLDDGATQLVKLGYDASGNVTNLIDPVGRSQRMVYSTNGVDLLEVRQTTGGANDLLVRYVYNSQHRPIAIEDAAGQWTTNTFNARGQITSTRNPNGETTSLTYDSNGYLISADGPLPGSADTMSLTYDAAGRVRTMTRVDGYTVTNSYDNLDRLTNVVCPDGTFTAFTYDKLDCVKGRDRLGREVNLSYDPMRRLTSMRDALNRLVRFEYCNCGALSGVIDPLGRATRWEHDLEGRVTTKIFPDGSRALYSYDLAGRLKSARDEKGQLRNYEYFADGALKRLSHPAAEVATPQMSFTYDPVYGRLLSMQDGIGKTTWAYVPVGSPGALNVASVDGPWANDTITYQYDVLGRATNRAINGVSQTLAFDAAGRILNLANALGSFGFAYDNATARLTDATYPNGQTAHYDYFGGNADRRLQRITNRKPDTSLVSRFVYAPNAVGSITNWAQELGAITNQWGIAYDFANQLLSISATQGASNFNYSYTYDAAANRLSESVASSNRVFQYNSLNQMTTASDTTQTNVTLEWNAENQLAAIVSGTNRTEFAYDGLGRRCRITEKTNGVVQSERRYVWCDFELCEERDGSDVVLQRFYGLGFTSGGGNYFYTFDHLGSVREVLDGAGQIQSRYAYGPYGARTALLENVPSPFGFTGHFRHARSGLSLTYLRPYDSGLGRWLARDPMGENAGWNLYAYVGNDPLNFVDPFGDCGIEWSKLGDAGRNFGLGAGNLFALLYVKTGEAAVYGLGANYLLTGGRGIAMAHNYARQTLATVQANIAWGQDFLRLLWLGQKDAEAFTMAEDMYFNKLLNWYKGEAVDQAKELGENLALSGYHSLMQELANRGVGHLQQSDSALGQFYGSVGDTLKNFFNPQNNDCNCP